MPTSFSATPRPDAEAIASASARQPANPFCTPGLAAARAARGETPWLLALGDGDCECIAFESSGRLRRRLELPSLPDVDAARAEPFWSGLLDLCGRRRTTDLVVHTFASPRASIPRVARERWRRSRHEYVLSLEEDDLVSRMSSNHRRNTRRGERAGFELRQADTAAACQDHVRLMGSSMQRRRDRGEDVPMDAEARRASDLVRHGAARIYQAVGDGEVLSSILVLLSSRGAYYHSAGTVPDGMKRGASHFLVGGVARALQVSGRTDFNLGGADPGQEGLTRFKTGFGARRVDLEAAAFDLAGVARRWVTAAAGVLRRPGA